MSRAVNPHAFSRPKYYLRFTKRKKKKNIEGLHFDTHTGYIYLFFSVLKAFYPLK